MPSAGGSAGEGERTGAARSKTAVSARQPMMIRRTGSHIIAEVERRRVLRVESLALARCADQDDRSRRRRDSTARLHGDREVLSVGLGEVLRFEQGLARRVGV